MLMNVATSLDFLPFGILKLHLIKYISSSLMIQILSTHFNNYGTNFIKKTHPET